MKEVIEQELAKQTQPAFKKLVLTECLQHLILQSLYRHRSFESLVFTGGTALRILYRIGRFSEDLDFSLPGRKELDFETLLKKVQADLASQQFSFDFRSKEQRNVAKADLRFSGALQKFGLSPLKDQKLTIKIEVDTRPPSGGVQEMALVAFPVSYTVSVFDLPSLFATKLHAIFFRGYLKGRDYYDLLWYLGKRVKPNIPLLNNAIIQTQGEGHEILENEFKEKLLQHLQRIDFAKVRAEVERFILNQEELKFLDFQPIASLLRNL